MRKSKNIEVTKKYNEKISDVSVYVNKKNNEYSFIDLRSLVDISILGVACDKDFSKNNITSIERLYRYQTADIKGFDIDYCKSCRRKYSFKVISDLYSLLWGIEPDNNIVDSSETIISAKQNIVRIFPELRKKQRGRPTVDWDLFRGKKDAELKELSYRVATIGNYMPVPACEQKILNQYFGERFDLLLIEIRKFYIDNIVHPSFTEELKTWLKLFVDKEGDESWKKFVKSNYLSGSFVGEDFNVKLFDGTAKQLSQFIFDRSVVMIDEYEKRISQVGAEP